MRIIDLSSRTYSFETLLMEPGPWPSFLRIVQAAATLVLAVAVTVMALCF